MPLGEAPITSYFTRIPKGLKRLKEPTAPLPAKKRRKNEQREKLPKDTPNLAVTIPRTPTSDFIDLTHDIQENFSCNGPVKCASVSSRGHTRARAMDTRTPPSLPIDLTADSPEASSSQTNDLGVRCTAHLLIPGVVTAEAPDGSSVNASSHTECTAESISENSPPCSSPHPKSDAHSLDDFVPSSQTQYLLPIQSAFDHEAEDFVPSSQSQYFAPTPTNIQHDDEGFVVPSCPSRRLLPMDDEVKKDSPDEEIVPSSQSQFDVELQPRNDHLRTLPEVAEPGIDITDIFEQPPLDSVAAPVGEEDGSETESDSEDEVPVALSRTAPPVRSPSPDESRSADCGGNSSESLPLDVKAFYDMVGSEDASYPNSFPQSLRWSQGEDTQ